MYFEKILKMYCLHALVGKLHTGRYLANRWIRTQSLLAVRQQATHILVPNSSQNKYEYITVV